jgi:hypothetical protein
MGLLPGVGDEGVTVLHGGGHLGKVSEAEDLVDGAALFPEDGADLGSLFAVALGEEDLHAPIRSAARPRAFF